MGCSIRIGKAFSQERLEYTRLVGDMNTAARDESLKRLQNDPDCNILLASIQAAGVGIDLRCAQNVYLMVRQCLMMNHVADGLCETVSRNQAGIQQ